MSEVYENIMFIANYVQISVGPMFLQHNSRVCKSPYQPDGNIMLVQDVG
jgi:hypothetical protein